MRPFAAMLITFACASCGTPPQPNAQPYEEKTYRTGSAVPVKDPKAMSDVKIVSPDAVGTQLSGSKAPNPGPGVSGK